MTSLNPAIVPESSLLRHWLQAQSIIEPPLSFDLAVGLSTIGALLRRTAWIDQVKWKVYPNLSILLVGPSGVGKDTTIKEGQAIIKDLAPACIVGGKTSEAVQISLKKMGDPAVGVIFAKEFADFFGTKDYQKGMLESITNLISGEDVDISLKSAQKSIIKNPTVTMMGGSTRDWLHKAMPEEAMIGGFYPRFLVIHEEDPKRHVALVKYDIPKEELIASMRAHTEFSKGLVNIMSYSESIGEVRLDTTSQEMYREFYKNRLRIFSPNAQAYANRSRDTVLRIALISAVSRFSDTVSGEDMNFGIKVMEYVAAHIDEALAPPTQHLRIVRDALRMLPATRQFLFRQLIQKYDRFHVKNALDSMISESQYMAFDTDLQLYYATDQQSHKEVQS